MNTAMDTTETKLPTKKYAKKRKTRSDKGVKRSKQKEAKPNVSKVSTQPGKYLFDEHVINSQWWMQVKDNFASRSNNDLYVMELMIDGIRFTYRNYFADPTLAYAMGVMFLDYRYKNKDMYQ